MGDTTVVDATSAPASVRMAAISGRSPNVFIIAGSFISTSA